MNTGNNMFNEISVNPPHQTSNISPGHSHSLQTSQATTYLAYSQLPNTQIPSCHPYMGCLSPENNQPLQSGKPFYVCRIHGNISRCNGCRGIIDKEPPPNDLVIMHEECHYYPHPKTRQMVLSMTPKPKYYHFQLPCLKSKHPTFAFRESRSRSRSIFSQISKFNQVIKSASTFSREFPVSVVSGFGRFGFRSLQRPILLNDTHFFNDFLSSSLCLAIRRSILSLQARPVKSILLPPLLNALLSRQAIVSHAAPLFGFFAATSHANIKSFDISGHLNGAIFLKNMEEQKPIVLNKNMLIT